MEQHFIRNCSEMVKVLVRQWDEINLWFKLITYLYFFKKPVNKKKRKLDSARFVEKQVAQQLVNPAQKLLNPVATFTQVGKKG